MVIRHIFMFVFFSLAISVQAAPTATVDRTVVNEGESLRLVLEGGDGDPDLGPLEALFVVHGTSTSSQVSFINGRMSSTKQYIVTLSPKQTGRIIIPAIQFGKEKTTSFEILVRKAGSSASGPSGRNIFIEVSVSPKQPYVQSQVVYTVKLFHAMEIRDGSLSQPKMDDVVIERLGKDKTYQTVLKGVRYQVTERRYALFPQSSGEIRIPPTVFSGQVVDMRGRFQGRSNDPFNRFFSQGTTRPVQLRSDEVKLQVRARPAASKASVWLPSKNLELTESWSQNLNQVRVGEPITRTIRIEAQGLTGAQLPEIGIDSHPAFKQYPDQPKVENLDDGETLIGVREDKIAIVPNQDGQITLPEIRLEWWNTRINRKEVARIPARELTVLPAKTISPAQPSTPLVLNAPGENRSLVNLPASAPASDPVWMWISVALSLAWLATGIAWWKAKTKYTESEVKESVGSEMQVPNLSNEKEAIRRACIANDAVKARKAFILWGQARWPEASISNLADLSNSFESDKITSLCRKLDASIYSANRDSWNGMEFWDNCGPLLKSAEKIDSATELLLPELYPQR